MSKPGRLFASNESTTSRILALPVEGHPHPNIPPHLIRALTQDEYDAAYYLAQYLDESHRPPNNPLLQGIINQRHKQVTGDTQPRFTKKIIAPMFQNLFAYGDTDFNRGVRRLCGLTTFPNGQECRVALHFARDLLLLKYGDPHRIPNSQEIIDARKERVIIPQLGYIMPSVNSIKNNCVIPGKLWKDVISTTFNAPEELLNTYLYRHAELDDLVNDYKAVCKWINNNNAGEQIVPTQSHIDTYMNECGGFGFRKYYQVLKRYPNESINTIRIRAQETVNPLTASRINRNHLIQWSRNRILNGIHAAIKFYDGKFPTGQHLDDLSHIQTVWINQHNGSLEGIQHAPSTPIPSHSQVVKGSGAMRGITKTAAEYENQFDCIAQLSSHQTYKMASIVRNSPPNTFYKTEIPHLVKIELGIGLK